jgi:hypothetical protein
MCELFILLSIDALWLPFLPNKVNKEVKYNGKDNANENAWQDEELELHRQLTYPVLFEVQVNFPLSFDERHCPGLP